MKDFIYQIDDNDCGFASLKMMLAIVSKNKNYLFLPRKKEPHAYSLLELKNIAKEHGLFLSGYLVNNFDQIVQLKSPFILVIKHADGNKHALLIKKINNIYTYVYDPSNGKKVRMSKNLLKDINSGLEVLTMESYNYKALDLDIEPLVNVKDLVKVTTLEALAILSYFFSAYFIDHESHFLYPIILMVVGALFAIGYKISAFNTMKRFDENYIEYTYDIDKYKRENNYRLMHKTKSGLLSTNNNIILSLTSVLAINIILILQNKYAVFVLLTSGLLVLFDALFLSERNHKNMAEVEQKEKKSLAKDNISLEEYINDYEEIKEKTYRIVRHLSLKRIIMYFILLIVTVLMSGVTENANLYFVLFYFAMSLFTYTSLDNLINMIDHNKENIINQTKFYELISSKKNDKSLQD